jgi:hypothetical protein
MTLPGESLKACDSRACRPNSERVCLDFSRFDRRLGGVLRSDRTELGQSGSATHSPANGETRSDTGRNGFLFVELRGLEPTNSYRNTV